MNPAWWAVVITGLTAAAGWGAYIARLLWTGRGILDQIRADLRIAGMERARIEQRLDQHLAWHEQHGGTHALLSKSRQRPRQPGQ